MKKQCAMQEMRCGSSWNAFPLWVKPLSCKMCVLLRGSHRKGDGELLDPVLVCLIPQSTLTVHSLNSSATCNKGCPSLYHHHHHCPAPQDNRICLHQSAFITIQAALLIDEREMLGMVARTFLLGRPASRRGFVSFLVQPPPLKQQRRPSLWNLHGGRLCSSILIQVPRCQSIARRVEKRWIDLVIIIGVCAIGL